MYILANGADHSDGTWKSGIKARQRRRRQERNERRSHTFGQAVWVPQQQWREPIGQARHVLFRESLDKAGQDCGCTVEHGLNLASGIVHAPEHALNRAEKAQAPLRGSSQIG